MSLHSRFLVPETSTRSPFLENEKVVNGDNGHGALAVTWTPAHLAAHAFEYVLPLLPHTGLISFVHTHALGLVALGVVALGVVALGVVALGLAAVVALLGPVAVVVDMTFSFLGRVCFRTNTQAHALCTRRLDGGFVCTNVFKNIRTLNLGSRWECFVRGRVCFVNYFE